MKTYEFEYKLEGEGKPVVLLHGLIGNLEIMASTADFLASKGFKACRVSYPPEKFTLEGYADALVRMLDSIGISKFVMFGTSMGGYVAQIVASKHPNRLDGLVLANTFASFREFKRKRGLMMRLSHLVPAKFLFAYFEREFRKTYSQDEVEVLMGFVRKVGKKPLVARLKALANAPDTVRFDKKFPVAVFSGKDDPTITEDVLLELKRAASPDFFYVFSTGRHFPYLFAKEEFNSKLLEFLKTVWG